MTQPAHPSAIVAAVVTYGSCEKLRIWPKASPSNDNAAPGAIGRVSRLGGLLKYYCRKAA